MDLKEYCMQLHGLTEEQFELLFYNSGISYTNIGELIKLSQITGMRVSEHADELATLIKQEKAITV